MSGVIFKDQSIELFMGPRPGKKSFDRLAGLKLTHCCTLLSEREGAPLIKKIAARLDCEWVWLPIEGGHVDTLKQVDLHACFAKLAMALAETSAPRLYFHCSAGIHRTGFFVYALLRAMGLSEEAARARLAEIRLVTFEQVGEERLRLVEALMAADKE